eukprot:tig00020902_g14984.t1
MDHGRTREAPPGLDALDDPLLTKILSFLGFWERLRSAGVCRRWRTASFERPLPTDLSLTVAADVRNTCGRPPTVERLVSADHLRDVPPDDRGAPALPTCDAAALLRLPLCASLEEIELSVYCAADVGRLDRPAVHLADVAAAFPPTLRRLRLRAPCHYPFVLGDLFLAVGVPLSESAPALEHLSLEGVDGEPGFVPAGRSHELPPLLSLRVLDATLAEPDVPLLSSALPSLQLVRRVAYYDGAACGALPAMASAGIRARDLQLLSTDLRCPRAAAALCAVLKIDPGDPGVGPARLALARSVLPDSWPDQALAGLERLSLTSCVARPASLRLPAAAPSLRHVRLVDLRLPHDDLRAGELDLLAALEALGDTVQIEVCLSDLAWPPAALRGFLRGLRSSPALLRRVEAFVGSEEPSVAAEAGAYLSARAALR